MTNTPETDNLARGNHVVPTEFAEHLERERDEWKAKYLQQNKDLGYELLDPNGTIWSECKRLQIELTAITEQRDMLTEAISRILELATHDIHWAIEEIGRLSLTNNQNE
jgi:hypothetical protein